MINLREEGTTAIPGFSYCTQGGGMSIKSVFSYALNVLSHVQSIILSAAYMPQKQGFPVLNNSDTSEFVFEDEKLLDNGAYEGYFTLRSLRIRYQRAGTSGPAVILVHGFGACLDHWRVNIPLLAPRTRVLLLDMAGYGYANKPDPILYPPNTLYTIDNWAEQVIACAKTFFPGEQVTIIGHSVGATVALEAANRAPSLIPAVQIQNIAPRGLHRDHQTLFFRPIILVLQILIITSPLAWLLFQIAKNRAVMRWILLKIYGRKECVTPEFVEEFVGPSQLPGAQHVLAMYACYTTGSTPEQLIRQASQPLSIVWGALDPLSKIVWGRKMAQTRRIEQFEEFSDCGHCPHHEAPEQVSDLMYEWAQKYSSKGTKWGHHALLQNSDQE